MFEIALALLTWDWEEQEVRDAIIKIAFDLSQSRPDAKANITAQSSDRLIRFYTFNDKKGLNQLSAIEFRFRAKIAQVLSRAQAHQAFHSLISFSHCS
jgi:hypothetical protein